MKRFLSILPFVASLICTVLVLMMFAATGDASMALLIPFALAVLLFTHDNLIE